MLNALLPLLLSFTPEASAAQVLVPDLTPAELTDATLAFMLYDRLMLDLKSYGVSTVNADEIRDRSGPLGDTCAENPGCPQGLLTEFDMHLVVVGSVARAGEQLDISFAFYGAGDTTPINRVTELVPAGREFEFIRNIAAQTAEVVSLLELTGVMPKEVPAPDPVDADAEAGEGQPTDTSGPPAPTDPAPPTLGGNSGIDFGPANDAAPLRVPAHEDAREAQRRSMGLSNRDYRKFMQSDLSRKDWTRRNRVRFRQVSIEVQGSLAQGPLTRVYDVHSVSARVDDGFERVYIDERTTERRDDKAAMFQQDVLLARQHLDPPTTDSFGAWDPILTGALAINVSPYVEVGVLAGAVRAERMLYRGWTVNTEGSEPAGVNGSAETLVQNTTVGLFEPRMRVFPIALGMFKPYLQGGLTILVFDEFDIPPTVHEDGKVAVEYDEGPIDAGAYIAVPFATAGLGLMVDAHPNLGIFVEGVGSVRLVDPTRVTPEDVARAIRSKTAVEPTLNDWQAQVDDTDNRIDNLLLIRPTAGIQLRF